MNHLMLRWAVCVLAVAAAPVRPAVAQTADEAPAPTAASTLAIRAFGDVQWVSSGRPETPNSFALGQFDLFMTATLSERVNVLAEIVLEAGTSTRVVTDLERLQFTFRLNDYLQVSAGRYHPGIGYYHTAFHHGAFFETAIGRPRVFAFEDEGGPLPLHDVGVSVRGAVPRTGAALTYLLEIGNGRTWDGSTEDEHIADSNRAKAINAGLSYRPGRWRGLEIGGSLYRDTIGPDASSAVSHAIAVGFVVYRTASVEVLAELLSLAHRTSDGASFRNNAGYVQLAKSFGKLRPYYRYNRMAIRPDTPLIGSYGAHTSQIGGLRFDSADWVALKAQYQRTNETRQRGINSVAAQLVFVF